jgi:hypothetical protein
MFPFRIAVWAVCLAMSPAKLLREVLERLIGNEARAQRMA